MSNIKRSEALSTRFGGGKFGVGRFSRKQIIQNKNISTSPNIKRSEALSTRFGSGKFGVGRFSRKQIIREKHL
jgi:hypothetical protein